MRSPLGNNPTNRTCACGRRSDRYWATAWILVTVLLATAGMCVSSCMQLECLVINVVVVTVILYAQQMEQIMDRPNPGP